MSKKENCIDNSVSTNKWNSRKFQYMLVWKPTLINLAVLERPQIIIKNFSDIKRYSWTPASQGLWFLQQWNHLIQQNFPSFENQRSEKKGRPQGRKIHFIKNIPIYFAQIFPVFHFHDEHPKVDRMKWKEKALWEREMSTVIGPTTWEKNNDLTQSTINTFLAPAAWAANTETAALLWRQNPMACLTPAWWPGGRTWDLK